MSHGPIFLWQLIYQAKTDVVNLGRPETVSVDRWLQPLSLPVPPKPSLHASRQPFQPYEETARFPEIVSEDRWHQPWSEPAKPRVSVGPSSQQFLALTEAAPFAETVTEDRWHQPWSEPIRQKIGIAATEHPLVSFDPFPFVSFSWFNALSEPVRQALRLITGANPDEFFSESARFPEIVSEDRWHQPWSEPVRRATATALQSTTTLTAVIASTASIDGWGSQLSIPQCQLSGLATASQQFLAFDPAVFVASVDSWAQPWSPPPKPKTSIATAAQQTLAYAEAAPFPETVSEDRWHESWAEPVRTKPPLPAGEQQAVAFVPVISTQVFEDSWHQRWTDPIQLSATWKTADNSAGFIAVQAPVPSIDGWGSPWAESPKAKPGTTAALQQFLAFAPFVTTAVPSVDGWAQPWSTPSKLKINLNVAAQQALAFDPAVFVPSIDGWQKALAEPVRVQSRITSDAIFFPPNFSAAVAPSFGYFGPFSEPQRQIAGLAARYQQDAAYGFVPIVQAFVFFFGNEEPLPWPGYRSNQFIRENYDSFVLPPFPIPNPPQTQAKFTVSGPSVSDLFPVSGVVYPYAPETRKTVP